MSTMGNKGNKRHIKRLASSKYMKIWRKRSKYVAKPTPGRHDINHSITLLTVIKEKLFLAASSKEARAIIKSGKVEVNGRPVREERYPIGFADVIHLIPNNVYYTVSVGREGAFQIEESKDGKPMPLKVVGKYIVEGGKTMLRLHDGRIVGAEKEVNVNDSIELGRGAFEVIKLESGRRCLVIGGTHSSERGTIKEIIRGSATSDTTVKVEGREGTFETLLDNIMVI